MVDTMKLNEFSQGENASFVFKISRDQKKNKDQCYSFLAV